MRIARVLAALVLALAAAGAAEAQAPAGQAASVDSPGRVLQATVTVEDGVARYAVRRLGEPVVAPSRLGFELDGAPDLTRFRIAGETRRTVDETWALPWGEKAQVRNRFNELRVELREAAAPGRRLDLVFRLYDDGLGFRYELPRQKGVGAVRIADELTEFRFARPATAWWIPARRKTYNEQLYETTPLLSVSHADTPFTLRTDGGLHLAVHEAALVDFAAMTLRRSGDVLKAELTPWSDGIAVRAEGGFVTPWRTLQVSDTAAGLLQSDLILNLNEPNRLGDVAWVEPGKYVGVWWAMHLDKWTWGQGPRHGATTENVKRYIDFAAAHGFKGVLAEGWNRGWDGDWFKNGEAFSFTESYPDFDLKAVTDHARSKGVRLIGHHETAGAVTHYEQRMGPAFDLYARHGVTAVKTGYVTEDGRILRRDGDGREHREFHDGQFAVRHHQKVVEEAARRRIAINTHEPIKDTGLRRTYPNWISREGARGQEFNAWGDPGNPPEHVAILPFTRMLAGPMDYTPGIFDLHLGGKPKNRVNSTLAQQLALYVVLYSPIQMAADLPENYEKHPDAFRFIKEAPTDWAETRVLAGEIGDYAVVARKDRRSADWFLGAVTDENGRVLPTGLGFLDPGVTYRAEIHRDGDGAHWSTAPYDFKTEALTVTSADVLPLRLAAGGGQAIRFTPVREAR